MPSYANFQPIDQGPSESGDDDEDVVMGGSSPGPSGTVAPSGRPSTSSISAAILHANGGRLGATGMAAAGALSAGIIHAQGPGSTGSGGGQAASRPGSGRGAGGSRGSGSRPGSACGSIGAGSARGDAVLFGGGSAGAVFSRNQTAQQVRPHCQTDRQCLLVGGGLCMSQPLFMGSSIRVARQGSVEAWSVQHS